MKGKHSILFLPMFPASSDVLQQACSTQNIAFRDDAAAAIALPLIAAAAGLAGVGLGHCGEQVDQVARMCACIPTSRSGVPTLITSFVCRHQARQCFDAEWGQGMGLNGNAVVSSHSPSLT
jgi:hypothetical protein